MKIAKVEYTNAYYPYRIIQHGSIIAEYEKYIIFEPFEYVYKNIPRSRIIEINNIQDEITEKK